MVSIYVYGFISTLMLAIFHNLIVIESRWEMSIAQIFLAAALWPLVMPVVILSWCWMLLVTIWKFIRKQMQR